MIAKSYRVERWKNRILKSILFVILLCAVFPAFVWGLAVERSKPENQTTEIAAGSEPVTILYKANGKQLQFQWNLNGPGKLDGESAQSSAVFYVPPDKVVSRGETAIVSFKVVDYEENQFNDSVIFKITPAAASQSESTAPEIRPEASKNVRIVDPAAGGEVGESKMVSGEYDDSVQDDIWVFVWPEKAPGRGYPQSGDAFQGSPAEKNHGEWSVRCYFGGPAQSYDIVVYTADKEASQKIAGLLMKWAKESHYPGIDKARLPNGMTKHHKIRVRKTD